MTQQSQATHFQNHNQGFDDADFDLDSPSPLPLPKNKSMIRMFLQKLSPQIIKTMEIYLAANKHYLSLPQKPKITLYEDVLIIYEFRKVLDSIIFNQAKTTEALCLKLQYILHRSKVTIKDRMGKKLCHLTEEDIADAIKNRGDFVFDKKNEKSKKWLPPFSSHASKGRIEYSPREREAPQVQVLAKREERPNDSHIPEQRSPDHKEAAEIRAGTNNRVYKYGRKAIHGPIFIYANRLDSVIRVVGEVEANKIRHENQFQTEVEPPPPTPSKAPPFSEKCEDRQTQCNSLNPPNQIKQTTNYITQNLNNLESIEIFEFVTSCRKKVSETVSSQPLEIQYDMESQLQAIELLSEELKSIRHSESKKKDINEDFSPKCPSSKRRDTAHFEALDQDYKTPRTIQFKEPSEETESRRFLFQMCNNIHNLQALKTDPSLFRKFVWSPEEDHVIYSYYFTSDAYKIEMSCMLRYKNLEGVLERMKFLNLPVSQQLASALSDLSAGVDERRHLPERNEPSQEVKEEEDSS